jgi:hypothetical protein
MKILRVIIALLVLGLNTTPLLAQSHTQTIRGDVVDKNTGAFLPGATIVLLGSEPLKGTLSDDQGNFRLTNVPIGRQSIQITYIGYYDVTLSNLDLNSSKEMVLHIEMEEKLYQGAEVIIRAEADKSAPINKMTTVSSRVFSIEETEKYAGARSDIARMASNFAGVTGSDDSRNDIIIRGNTPSGLLWRLDGMDIPNPNHFAAFGTSGGPICILRNNLLSNSDFLTAAFPAEYGNALAGVFDVKMINGNNEKHEFLAQVAFNGIEAGAEGPLSKKNQSSYILNYRYSTLDLFSKMGIQMGTGQGVPKYQDLLFKLNFPKTKAGSFSLFGIGGLSHIAFLDSKKDTTKDKIDFYGSEGWDITNHSNQGVIGLNHSYLINSHSFVKSTIGFTYHNFYTTHDTVTPVTLGTYRYEGTNDEEMRLFIASAYNKKFSARHNLKAGIIITGTFDHLVDSLYHASDGTYRYANNYRGYSLLLQPYAEYQVHLSERITLNTGLHLQYFNISNAYSIEPRLGLKWQFARTQQLGFGYGMHSQTIPVTIFYNQSLEVDGSYRLTNNHLDFTRSHHFALNYDWSISNNTRLKAEAYYQHLYGIPVNGAHNDSYSLLNEGANFQFESPDTLANRGIGRNYGIELTLERFISKGFYFLATASLYDSQYKGSDGIWRNTAFNGRYTANLLAGKEFNIKLRKKKEEKRKKTFIINLKTTRSGGQRYTPIDEAASLATQRNVYIDNLAFSKKFPDYWRTDLKLGYKMNGKRITVEWSLEITNLFNQKNVYNQTFNRKTGESYFTWQLGRVIIPQYRITF